MKSGMRLNKKIYLILLFNLFLSISLFPEKEEEMGTPLEYSEIWNHVLENSHSGKAALYEEKSVELAISRASKHWTPRVYTDVRSYNTNDPAMNFFSTLGQRAATDADFSTKSGRNRISNFVDSNNNLYTVPNSNTLNLFAPDTLNYPGSNTYSRGTIGVDLPLYEGGSRDSIKKMTEKKLEGKKKEREFVVQNEYFSAVFTYSNIIVMKNYYKKISELSKVTDNIQKRFQLKGNPVGYSGFLGIKSLQNFLKANKDTVKIKIISLKESLTESTGNKISNWTTKDDSILQFSDRYLHFETIENNNPEMKITGAYRSYSEGSEIQIDAEKARHLPKIGVFGEAYAYNGSRDTATSYNAGLYLQMNILSPSDLNVVEEAKNNSLAMKEKVEDMKLKDKSKYSTLIKLEKAYKENVILLQETQKLQEEQIVNTQNLFSSGSINILQLTEVLNSVAEFYRKKAEIESEYLRIRAELTLFNSNTIGTTK